MFRPSPNDDGTVANRAGIDPYIGLAATLNLLTTMALRALIVAISATTTFGCGGSAAQLMPFSESALPLPCDDADARQFDFWIGEWDIESRGRDLGPSLDQDLKETGKLEAKVFPVTDGCAVVELTEGDLSSDLVYGFSVRAYDRDRGKWVYVVNWPKKNKPVFSILEGAFRHRRIEAFSEAENANRITRSTFSDINESSYRWDAALTVDSSASWSTYWIMEGKRRGRYESPVFNGPAAPRPTRPTCTLAEMGRFEFLIGSWEGALEESPDQRARLEVYPILNGCAHMEFLEIDRSQGTYKRFAVRAYDTEIGRWVQFSTDNVDPRFERLEGGMDQHGGVLQTSGEGDQRQREDWSIVSETSVYWTRSESRNRGMNWTHTVRASLNRAK